MRLMISVVSAMEAREALLGGAEILDVKNPAEGSLGAPSPMAIQEIKNLSSGSVRVSAAIGDMPDLPGTAALAALGAATCGADYIKVGLYGSRTEERAIKLLRAVKEAVRGFHSSVIAAAYADFERAGTLDPLCLPSVAVQAGVQGCLLDTAVKDGHSLIEFLDPKTLSHMVEQTHANGLLFGLAGALQGKNLPLVQSLGVDIVGIRTAACRDGQRDGPLVSAQVLQLHRILVPVV
ncbi:MAG: (5-formylfuran-3-yl)methyl phosphate synthase [Acidobacteria bacterium]|nr:(5-formylfuran-3-yl)methyl phosphate synthase [Acidobacteriota bacterium]